MNRALKTIGDGERRCERQARPTATARRTVQARPVCYCGTRSGAEDCAAPAGQPVSGQPETIWREMMSRWMSDVPS